MRELETEREKLGDEREVMRTVRKNMSSSRDTGEDRDPAWREDRNPGVDAYDYGDISPPSPSHSQQGSPPATSSESDR